MTVATGLSFWHDGDGDSWDKLHMAGEVWPGIWTIDGAGVSRKIDVKRVKGSDQATIKDEGYNPAKITLNGTIWTSDQWRNLQKLLPLIHPRRKGGGRKPVQIINPQANFLGIENIYIQSIGVPSLDKASHLMTISISAIEWVPKPKPVKKAAGTGSKANQRPVTEDDGEARRQHAEDENELERQLLDKEKADKTADNGLAKNQSKHIQNTADNANFS